MVEIQQNGSEERSARLREPAHISFALERTRPGGAYAIVQLLTVGDRMAWVENTESRMNREHRVVTTLADLTGTYALVEVSPTAARATTARKPKGGGKGSKSAP